MGSSFQLASYIFLIVCLFPFILKTTCGLKCWACSGDVSPLCDSTLDYHEGKSVDCPDTTPGKWYPPYYNTCLADPECYPPQLQCFIMKTQSHTTGSIEISKGCVFNHGYFLKRLTDTPADLLDSPECYTHSEEIFEREVTTHTVTVCVCEKDDCNKVTLGNATFGIIGEEDIKQRKTKEKSGASLQSTGLVIPGIMMMVLISVKLPLFST